MSELGLSLNNYEAGNLHHVVDSRNILDLSFTTDQLKNSENNDFERKGTLCTCNYLASKIKQDMKN